MPTLVGLSYSPWTEKARWALSHHKVPFAYEEYLPMLGEPLLRGRMHRLRGKVTVPVLLDGSKAVMDSFAICEHAEAIGRGAPLLGGARARDILVWVSKSESALSAGRAILVERMRHHAKARAEALPSFVPDALRARLLPVADLAILFLKKKHGTDKLSTFDHESTLRDILDELREALKGGRETLLDGFSFADIAAATMLQLVSPVSDRYMPIGPATRDVWTHPELARHYADLLAWRDALYAKHRPS